VFLVRKGPVMSDETAVGPEPEDGPGMVAVEVERCQRILSKFSYMVGNGPEDLERHVERCFERSEKLRALLGGWRWSWEGTVKQATQRTQVEGAWARACRETLPDLGPGYFNMGSSEAPSSFYFFPEPLAWEWPVSRNLGPVLGGQPYSSGRLRMEWPSSSEGLADLEAQAASWLKRAGDSVKVLDPCSKVAMKQRGGRPGRVFGRAISAVCKAAPEALEGEKLKDAGRRFSEKMGQVWRGAGARWRVVLSAAPSSAMRLGNMGENNSCLQFGYSYSMGKTSIPSKPGGLVAFLYRLDGDPEAEAVVIPGAGPVKGRPAGRCFGFLSSVPGRAGGSFSNHYLMNKETFLPVMGQALSELYGVDAGTLDPDEDLVQDHTRPVSGTTIYCNGDGWSWRGPGMSQVMLTDTLRDQRGVCDCCSVASPVQDNQRECLRCGDHTSDGFWCHSCEDWTCTGCGHYDQVTGYSYCDGCGTLARCLDCGEDGTFNLTVFPCPDCGDLTCRSCLCQDRTSQGGDGARVCSPCRDSRQEERENLAELARQAEAEAAEISTEGTA